MNVKGEMSLVKTHKPQTDQERSWYIPQTKCALKQHNSSHVCFLSDIRLRILLCSHQIQTESVSCAIVTSTYQPGLDKPVFPCTCFALFFQQNYKWKTEISSMKIAYNSSITAQPYCVCEIGLHTRERSYRPSWLTQALSFAPPLPPPALPAQHP